MSKWLSVVGVSIILSLLTFPGLASAHVLKIDNDIGAVLHIQPDDNPTIGSPTDYIMSFDDDSGRFSLLKCNCSVSVIKNGQHLATKPLEVSTNNVSENHYTFMSPGVYTLRFTGTPKRTGAFQAFVLNYDVRVTGGQTGMQPVPPILWIGISMGVGLVLLAAYVIDYMEDK